MTDLPLATYIPVAFALAITPGATTAVVVRNALDRGWRGGLGAAMGAAVANATYAAASGLGVAVVLAKLPGVFSVIRAVGAIYLAWLGLSSLRRAVRGTVLTSRIDWPVNAVDTAIQRRAGLREGIAVNLVNPATLTFYVAVVPAYMPPGSGGGAFMVLTGLHVTIAFACHIAWALAFDRLRGAFSTPAPIRALDTLAAAALFWLAVRMVL